MDLPSASSWRCSWLTFGDGLFRAGAALVPDYGHRLALAEPGAGRERLIEPVRAQLLPEPSYQLGLRGPEHRPGPQADPLTQAIGGTL